MTALTRFLLAWVLGIAVAAAQAAEPAPPDTPVGRVFGAWLQAFNAADAAQLRAFGERHRRKPENVEGLLEFRAETGGFALLRIERNEQRALTALLQERESDTVARMELSVDDADPPKVEALSLRPVPRPPDLALPRLDQADALRAIVQRADAQAAEGRFAGTVLVARRGQTLLHRHWGLADRETNRPVDAETRFRIGSMNKMFTAVAVLQLVEAGQLGLDDPMGKHLKDYPNRDAAARVTVRHLLTHGGGTGDFFGPEFDARRMQLREIADYVALFGPRPLAHEPGARFEYSNFGYILLGAIVEAVAGRSYDEVMRQRVFGPAGMVATGAEPETVTVPQRASGYMRRGERWVSNADTLPWRGTPAGGGYSTATDLLNFAQALDSGRLLSRQMLDQATGDQHDGYGYGFGVRGEGALRHYGHGGGAPGMNGELQIYPELGVVLVALSNLDPPVATRLVDYYALRMPAP